MTYQRVRGNSIFYTVDEGNLRFKWRIEDVIFNLYSNRHISMYVSRSFVKALFALDLCE